MAAVVHKLLHPHSHAHQESTKGAAESQPAQSHPAQQPAQSHAPPPPPEQQTEMDRERAEEKHQLAQWEEHSRPMDSGEIHQDPDHNVVGNSSRVLRQQDFELIKTLGTGAGTWAPIP
jgi:hypothetical protein